MAIKPISPSEVLERKPEIPDGVIEVFNELITKNFSKGRAVVLQKHALSAIAIKLHISKEKVIANEWLDVADIFKDAGWDAKCDPLGITCNNSEPSFIFIKKGN